MKGHPSAVFQRDELTDRETLRSRVRDELRREIADGANAYDATWPDMGKTPVLMDRGKCAELGFFRMDSPPLPLLRAARLDLEALMVRGDWPET
jgi:hypothetical protein